MLLNSEGGYPRLGRGLGCQGEDSAEKGGWIVDGSHGWQWAGDAWGKDGVPPHSVGDVRLNRPMWRDAIVVVNECASDVRGAVVDEEEVDDSPFARGRGWHKREGQRANQPRLARVACAASPLR